MFFLFFFFLIFPRKQALTFLVSKPNFNANCIVSMMIWMKCQTFLLRKKRKVFQYVVCWKVYPACQALKEIDTFSRTVTVEWLLLSFLTLSVPNFGRHLSFAFFFFFFFNKLSFERRLYVKLKDWMSNSIDPDETAHWAVSSGSMLFAKAYYIYHRLWQWES